MSVVELPRVFLRRFISEASQMKDWKIKMDFNALIQVKHLEYGHACGKYIWVQVIIIRAFMMYIRDQNGLRKATYSYDLISAS